MPEIINSKYNEVSTVNTSKYANYIRDDDPDLANLIDINANDSNILALNDDLALIRAIVARNVKDLATGDFGSLYINLKKCADDYGNMPNLQKKAAIADQMAGLIQTGYDKYMLQEDIIKGAEQIRKLSESERDRLVQLQKLVKKDDIALMFGEMAQVFRRLVKDKTISDQLQNELRPIFERYLT